MKKGIKKLFSAVTAFVMLSITCISTQENNITMSANAVNGSGKGVKDGYYWELWTSDDTGTTEMKVGDNGSYITNWNGIDDYFAVAGKKWEDNRLDWSEIGEIKIQYDVDYKPEGNSSIGATGFTSDLMVEFFIIEDWEEWSLPNSYKSLGEITVDGHIYDVYKMGRAITIHGLSESLDRYFSVRREGDTSTSGTINVTKHFEEWEKLGMELGRELIEVGFCVQAFQSSGSADVKTNIMTIDGVDIKNLDSNDITTTTTPSTTTTTVPSTTTAPEVTTTTTASSTTTAPEFTTTTTASSTTTAPEDTTTTTASSTTTAPEFTTTTTEPNAITFAGDANCDGAVDVADIVLVKCYLINAENYSMTKQGTANADVQGESNGINVQDVVAIQKYVLKLIEELPLA
ncbi:MAG: glycoside hydrolase family 11 protein [Ruminococcus sp.]|nr:glycoside hydrolase family 11 protein [Ruminococcus sp.]